MNTNIHINSEKYMYIHTHVYMESEKVRHV